MKKQFTTFLITTTFLTLGVFALVNQVRAETEISGNITSDTSWKLANSPYIVTATVQVLQGSRLTIEPGVIVKFNQNTGLNIDGELYAVGLADNLIIFTSNNTSPNKGDWNGIKFFSNSTGASFDNDEYIDGSIIKYSKIEYGGRLDYGGNISTSGGGPLFISDSIINNSAHYGIYIDSTSNSKIIGNRIENNGGATVWSGGITWLACHNITIKQNTIVNNSIGILAGNLINSDIISYNNIYNNQIHNFKFITPQSLKDYNVQYNYWGSINESIIDSKIYDYFDDITLSKVIYKPVGLAELKFDGADTFSQPSTCTSWIYSNWGTCQLDGTQTRNVISSSPGGCVGGSPVLTQSCTYIPPTCTSWIYSDWSSCSSSGQQTRTITSSSPNGCTGGNPVLTQSCIYTPPTCTSWIYSDWSTCSNGQQTRTIISAQPTNCAGGNPILNQSCTSIPVCTEDNWSSTLSPTACPNNGQQTKGWTKLGQCQNGVSHPSEETVNCDYQIPTCTSFTYSNWSACNSSGVQTRTVISAAPLNCSGSNPIKNQSCQIETEQTNIETTNNNQEPAKNVITNNNNQVANNQTELSNNSSSENKTTSEDVVSEEKSLITKIDSSLSTRVSGNILLQVEKNGEGWYVYPDTKKKYYLGRPADAFNIMRNLGLGIKHSELTSYLNSKFPSRLSGKILLDVEQNGEAYYVNPNDLKGYYLNRPADAFKVMREQGLGITNTDIRKIDIGEI